MGTSNSSKVVPLNEKGLKFEDGTDLVVDPVVFATGYVSTYSYITLHSCRRCRYGDDRDVTRDICEPEVASNVGEI
jgi:hypothetical protein